jgi:hypothetical protein
MTISKLDKLNLVNHLEQNGNELHKQPKSKDIYDIDVKIANVIDQRELPASNACTHGCTAGTCSVGTCHHCK